MKISAKTIVSALVLVMAMGALAAEGQGAAESASLLEQAKEVLPEGIVENALWDFIKWLVFLPALLLAPLLWIVGLFFQRLNVMWFVYGRNKYFFPKVFTKRTERLGEIVNVESRRAKYRDPGSQVRRDNSIKLNKQDGIFVFMGPIGGGKKLFLESQIDAGYIVSVNAAACFDATATGYKLTRIFNDRFDYLMPSFIFGRKRTVILIEWSENTALPLAGDLNKLLEGMAEFYDGAEKHKISIVLQLPGYHHSLVLSKDKYDFALEWFEQHLLTPTECKNLLDAFLDNETKNCETLRQKIEAEAKRLGKADKDRLAEYVWRRSFGRPSKIQDLVDETKYSSDEAWGQLLASLCAPWVDEAGKIPQWFAFLYLLTLKSALNAQGSVDLYELSSLARLDDSKVARALKFFLPPKKKRYFDMSEFKLELILESGYVRNRLLLDLIESMATDFPDALQAMFRNINNTSPGFFATERDIAKVFIEAVEIEPDLFERIKRLFALESRLAKPFGKVVAQAFAAEIRSERFFEALVDELLVTHCARSFEKNEAYYTELNALLSDALSPSEYVDFVFELYRVLSGGASCSPDLYGINYAVIVQAFDSAPQGSSTRQKAVAIASIWRFINSHFEEFMPEQGPWLKTFKMRSREFLAPLWAAESDELKQATPEIQTFLARYQLPIMIGVSQAREECRSRIVALAMSSNKLPAKYADFVSLAKVAYEIYFREHANVDVVFDCLEKIGDKISVWFEYPITFPEWISCANYYFFKNRDGVFERWLTLERLKAINAAFPRWRAYYSKDSVLQIVLGLSFFAFCSNTCTDLPRKIEIRLLWSNCTRFLEALVLNEASDLEFSAIHQLMNAAAMLSKVDAVPKDERHIMVVLNMPHAQVIRYFARHAKNHWLDLLVDFDDGAASRAYLYLLYAITVIADKDIALRDWPNKLDAIKVDEKGNLVLADEKARLAFYLEEGDRLLAFARNEGIEFDEDALAKLREEAVKDVTLND